MAIKAILYDLDGTMLPMNTQRFMELYFGALAQRIAKTGFDAELVMKELRNGIGVMYANDGSLTNEEVFFNYFVKIFGEKEAAGISDMFMDFYAEEFAVAKASCMPNPLVPELVAMCKERGIRQVMATNPLFPEIATRQRVGWTGCDFSDFELVTVYENSHYAKPNLAYYQEILDKLGLKGEECMMVGNNTAEDMVAGALGMKLFLVTDELINPAGEDISKYPNGSYEELVEYIKGII